jgi:hypothetical protein
VCKHISSFLKDRMKGFLYIVVEVWAKGVGQSKSERATYKCTGLSVPADLPGLAHVRAVIIAMFVNLEVPFS